MKLSQFKFKLPEEKIALHPTKYRDESRLMVLHKRTGEIEHKMFKDILNYFDDKDVFVFSNTKGGSYTRLYPGEDAHLQSDGNFILAEVDLDSYVYWKDGYFYFDNVTLKDIMQNLGRWYNVNIEFRNKEAMEYKMHFISDRTKDLEHTISLLNRMKKVTVTLQGNTLTVD